MFATVRETVLARTGRAAMCYNGARESIVGAAMPVQPAVQAMLDAMATAAAAPTAVTLDVAQRRKLMDDFTAASFNSVAESGPAMFEEFTHHVPVVDGVIKVRTYRPAMGGEHGCYVYIHGGGWWLCNIDL